MTSESNYAGSFLDSDMTPTSFGSKPVNLIELLTTTGVTSAAASGVTSAAIEELVDAFAKRDPSVDAARAVRDSMLGLAFVAKDFVVRKNREAEADSRESLEKSPDFGSW